MHFCVDLIDRQPSAHCSFIETKAGGLQHIVCLAPPLLRAVTSWLLLHLAFETFKM